jgi:hypothetical protein
MQNTMQTVLDNELYSGFAPPSVPEESSNTRKRLNFEDVMKIQSSVSMANPFDLVKAHIWGEKSA